MLDQILSHFPAHTYPLILVHDPDEVLAEESVLAALAGRGFSLVQESDPVLLRRRVQLLVPFRVEQPVIVVTAGPLNQLPYDLWQQGWRVELALHHFFPHYSYPVIQSLAPQQRWKLSQAPAPPARLGRQASLEAILSHVFEVPHQLDQPAALLRWLVDYHTGANPMPDLFKADLLKRLRALPLYREWPLEAMVSDPAAFRQFVDRQWQGYLQQRLGESGATYLLAFETDEALQESLPRLARRGWLTPVSLAQPGQWPDWMQAGLLTRNEEGPARRMAGLLEQLAEQAQPLDSLAEARWEKWQTIARTWAELTALYYEREQPPAAGAERSAYLAWQGWLDEAFGNWLGRNYGPLGGKKLPRPHHLYHVTTYMERQRQGRLALLVMDGMALADWQLIKAAWQERWPRWQFQEQLVLAQLPTITAISRQALVSGLRPADFDATLTHNQAEKNSWAAYWGRQDLPPAACAYYHLDLERQAPPPELSGTRLQAVCLILNVIDEMVHGANLGQAGLQTLLKLWLKEGSPKLEAVIEGLLGRGYTVFLSSDHGHTEAKGMGQPSEGVLVESRSRRARLYRERRTAEVIQQGFPGSILWGEDGLLPPGVWALLAGGRQAFAPLHQTVVSHGGMTLDEVVAPLVQIKYRQD